MRRLRQYQHPAPPGAIIVRIVDVDGEPYGFVREVTDEDDLEATYPSEQQPVEDVWRLVDNKLQAAPDAPVYVELEATVKWRPEWGEFVHT